jgi:hypothetical protein
MRIEQHLTAPGSATACFLACAITYHITRLGSLAHPLRSQTNLIGSEADAETGSSSAGQMRIEQHLTLLLGLRNNTPLYQIRTTGPQTEGSNKVLVVKSRCGDGE